MSPTDMAELLGAFNEATARLQAAHESLSAEVVRLQRELRDANQQLERSRRLAALGEMAAGIAHEIRNPLGSIRLDARMLESDLQRNPELQDEAGLARRIGSAVRTVDAVVRDVLAFAGDSRVHPQPVDLCELLDRAVQESLAAVPIPVLVHRNDLQSGVTRIVADPSLLHRALVNIICNALQSMQEDRARRDRPSELTIDAGVRSDGGAARGSDEAGERPPSRWIWLRVSDTGPGIPPEVLDRVFNPFFTTRAQGTGLGLAIVHRIVDAHGGRITVKNLAPVTPEHRPDGAGRGMATGCAGAAVEIELPCRTEPVAEAPEEPGSSDPVIVQNSRHRRRAGTMAARATPARVTEDAR